MIKLDTSSASLAYPTSSYKDLGYVRCLIVLIPGEEDCIAMTHRIWKLANAANMHVQLLSLCNDPAEQPRLRRGLVTMASLLQEGNVHAEVKIEFGTSWVEAVKQNSHPGDTIICIAEQRVGLWQRPLSQILQSNVQNPVYILSGLSRQNPSRSNWRSQVMAWLGSLGILVGAFLVQIRIVSMPGDWVQTILLIFSVISEAWLIGNWNSLFG